MAMAHLHGMGEVMPALSEKPLVSVIVPVYKVEGQLDRCIASIVSQSYRNLEIILVDDGSPDKCPAMCDAWAERDRRIVVIHQANAGLSAARNAGLDAMHGEYVAFVDSDDYVDTQFVARLLGTMQEKGAEIGICSIRQEDEQAAPLPDNRMVCSQTSTLTGRECLSRLSGDGCISYVVVWNKLYAARLWDGVRFPVGKLHEDEFTTYRIMDRCDVVALVPAALYHYVQHSGSIMHAAYSIRNLDRIEAFVQKLQYYRRRRYGELYASAFAAITWDLPHAVSALNLDDAEVHARAKEIFSQLKPLSLRVASRLGGVRPALTYALLCLCPFWFCRMRYGR